MLGTCYVWMEVGSQVGRSLERWQRGDIARYSLMDSQWADWISWSPSLEGNFEIHLPYLCFITGDTLHSNISFQVQPLHVKNFRPSRRLIQDRRKAIFEAPVVTETQVSTIFLSDLWGRRTFPTAFHSPAWGWGGKLFYGIKLSDCPGPKNSIDINFHLSL